LQTDNLCHSAAKLGYPLSHQWFSTRESNFGYSHVHRNPNQPEELFIGKNVLMIQLYHSFQRHAVDTTEIAAIGKGNPEVINTTLIPVGDLGHCLFFRKELTARKCRKNFGTGLFMSLMT
jgi:hypothetical protein